MPVRKWYTIYRAVDDEILTIGTSKECASNLDMPIEAFRSMLTRVKLGENRKYIIAIEEVDNDYEETNGKVEIYGEDNFGVVDSKIKYRIDETETMYLYLMGYNDKQIAKALNVPTDAVKRWRKSKKLKSLQDRGRPRKRRD